MPHLPEEIILNAYKSFNPNILPSYIYLLLRQPKIKSQNSKAEQLQIFWQFSPNNGLGHLMEHPVPVKPKLHSVTTILELLVSSSFLELIIFY